MSKESKANNSSVKEEKNKQAMNRRKLLGSLAVVGGVSAMPSNWVKPVINSVILPAHAQTSEEATPGLFLSTTNIPGENPFPTLTPTFTIIGVGPTFSGGEVFIDSSVATFDSISLLPFNSFFVPSTGFAEQQILGPSGVVPVILPGSSFESGVLEDSDSNEFTLTFTNTGGNLDVALTLL